MSPEFHEEFDEKFESGEDSTNDLDLSRARWVNQKIKRVNIDFPTWIVEGLDKQAKRLGFTRQAFVKVWIAERLKDAA